MGHRDHLDHLNYFILILSSYQLMSKVHPQPLVHLIFLVFFLALFLAHFFLWKEIFYLLMASVLVLMAPALMAPVLFAPVLMALVLMSQVLILPIPILSSFQPMTLVHRWTLALLS